MIESFESLAKNITDLETKVGARKGFFAHLLEEDDWSFVIKLHALFEAACTHLLLYHFDEPNLSSVIGRLELSGRSTGKIEMLGKLDLLGKEKRRFISNLSELRNSLVHDVRNSEFAFEAFVKSLDPKQLRLFAVSFSPYESTIRKFAESPLFEKSLEPQLIKQAQVESVIDRAKVAPKTHVWLGAYDVLSSIIEMYGYSDYRKWARSEDIFSGEDDVEL